MRKPSLPTDNIKKDDSIPVALTQALASLTFLPPLAEQTMSALLDSLTLSFELNPVKKRYSQSVSLKRQSLPLVLPEERRHLFPLISTSMMQTQIRVHYTGPLHKMIIEYPQEFLLLVQLASQDQTHVDKLMRALMQEAMCELLTQQTLDNLKSTIPDSQRVRQTWKIVRLTGLDLMNVSNGREALSLLFLLARRASSKNSPTYNPIYPTVLRYLVAALEISAQQNAPDVCVFLHDIHNALEQNAALIAKAQMLFPEALTEEDKNDRLRSVVDQKEMRVMHDIIQAIGKKIYRVDMKNSAQECDDAVMDADMQKHLNTLLFILKSYTHLHNRVHCEEKILKLIFVYFSLRVVDKLSLATLLVIKEILKATTVKPEELSHDIASLLRYINAREKLQVMENARNKKISLAPLDTLPLSRGNSPFSDLSPTKTIAAPQFTTTRKRSPSPTDTIPEILSPTAAYAQSQKAGFFSPLSTLPIISKALTKTSSEITSVPEVNTPAKKIIF